MLAIFAGGAVALANPSTAPSPHPGEKVFMQSGCFACHGQLGYGGAGPRFRGDKLLSADQYVVGQILLGRGIMPSFADRLNDDEIAAVATYIRNSWGNNFGPVTPDQVAEIRKSLQSGAVTQSTQ
jgi:mono/diheme cytochrome c family protein